MIDLYEKRHRIWEAIWQNAGDAIDKVLLEVYQQGYKEGWNDALCKLKEVKP